MYWLLIREWITFAANICILFITIYTFYITFISNRIRFLSVFESLSIEEGNSFSIIIENKTFSPLVIEKIALIIDNKYKIQLLRNFDEQIILTSYTTKKIESDKYSYLIPDIRIIGKKNYVLEVKTTRKEKEFYIKINKKTPKVSDELKCIPPNVIMMKNTYNGKIIPKKAIYALTVFIGGITKTVFIFNSGSMSERILGHNGISIEAIKSQETLNKFFYEWLNPSEIKYMLEPVNENLVLVNKEI